MRHIARSEKTPSTPTQVAFSVQLVPVDVIEVPDYTLKGIDEFKLEFDRNGEQLTQMDTYQHPPLRYPFRNRFQCGDFVQIADPVGRLNTWSCRGDEDVVFGVVCDAPMTKAELLSEHAEFFDPAMLPKDTADLMVTKDILDRIYGADPNRTSYDNDYIVYHLCRAGSVDHTHGLPESALAPLNQPIPDELAILHTVRELFLSEPSETPSEINAIFEPPANVRNVVTFDFSARAFKQPFKRES